MESKEDIVRVKKEPKDIWSNAGNDNNFDPVDSVTVENVETSMFNNKPKNQVNQAMKLQDKLDTEIFVDIECKYVKPELNLLSTNICKTEYEDYTTIVKVENQNQINYLDKKCHPVNFLSHKAIFF
ncbi:hypothetical protein TKK_0018511 [Trichogramma kaykai]